MLIERPYDAPRTVRNIFIETGSLVNYFNRALSQLFLEFVVVSGHNVPEMEFFGVDWSIFAIEQGCS
jgi:hypothetical protein